VSLQAWKEMDPVAAMKIISKVVLDELYMKRMREQRSMNDRGIGL
jgi:hypothetical protein